jgi:hypothetical protein
MRSGPGPRPARNSTGGLTLPAAVPQAALTLERLRDELAAMQSYEEPQPGAPGCYFGVSTRRVAYPADDPLGRALYIGQVDLEGHRSGLGILMWADGSRYLGEWLSDKRSGHGVQLFSDGSSYTGQFLASRRHGHGAALAVDGAQRCGWWQFGELHAQDRYTLRAARRPSGRGAGAGAGAAGGDSASSSPPSGLNETVNFISSPGEEEAAVVAAGSGAGVQLRAEVNEALRSALAAAAEARANAEALGAERARELLALAASPGLPGWSAPRGADAALGSPRAEAPQEAAGRAAAAWLRQGGLGAAAARSVRPASRGGRREAAPAPPVGERASPPEAEPKRQGAAVPEGAGAGAGASKLARELKAARAAGGAAGGAAGAVAPLRLQAADEAVRALKAARAAGDVAEVVALLRVHVGAEAAASAGCRLLWEMLTAPDAGGAAAGVQPADVVAAGAVEAAAACMAAHRASERAALAGVGALEALAADAACEAGVVRRGGAAAVVAAMGTHRGSATLQERGCGALGNMAGDEECELAVVAAGGVEAVVAAMVAHGAAEGVQLHGCGALWNLSGCEESEEAVAQRGGAGAAVRALDAHPGSAAVAEQACGALRCLAGGARGAAAVAECGGTAATVAAMAAHPAAAGVQEQACGALANLAMHEASHGPRDASADPACGAPAVDALLAALAAHAAHAGVAGQALAALADVSAAGACGGPGRKPEAGPGALAARGTIEAAVRAAEVAPRAPPPPRARPGASAVELSAVDFWALD